MVPRLTSASRCTGSVSPPEFRQLRHFSYIFPCRSSSWAPALPQGVPSRAADPVGSLCRAPRPEAALKALLRPLASSLGWQCLMKLRADVFPRKASFCRTANCPSSSRALPWKRTGNAWQLVRLGNGLSTTQLSRDKCCFKHRKHASPCWLPGVTNPAAHAFGGSKCSLPLRRGWEDAGLRPCHEDAGTHTCPRHHPEPPRPLPVPHVPGPDPSSVSPCGKGVLSRQLGEERCSSRREGQVEVRLPGDVAHVPCWALSSCLSQTRCRGTHGFIPRDIMHKRS